MPSSTIINDEKNKGGESILIELQLIFTGGSTHKYITIIVHYRRERKKKNLKKSHNIKESASVYSAGRGPGGRTIRHFRCVSKNFDSRKPEGSSFGQIPLVHLKFEEKKEKKKRKH